MLLVGDRRSPTSPPSANPRIARPACWPQSLGQDQRMTVQTLCVQMGETEARNSPSHVLQVLGPPVGSPLLRVRLPQAPPALTHLAATPYAGPLAPFPAP